MTPGWSLEPTGNGGPRGMIATGGNAGTELGLPVSPTSGHFGTRPGAGYTAGASRPYTPRDRFWRIVMASRTTFQRSASGLTRDRWSSLQVTATSSMR
jgi:hypothetical protein